jgi:hypothetical protein
MFSESNRWVSKPQESSDILNVLKVMVSTIMFKCNPILKFAKARNVEITGKNYWTGFKIGDVVRARMHIKEGPRLSSVHPFAAYNTWPMREGTIGVIEEIVLFHPELGGKHVEAMSSLSRVPAEHSIRMRIDGRWVLCVAKCFELVTVVTPADMIGRRVEQGILISTDGQIYPAELAFWMEICHMLTVITPDTRLT